MCCLSAIAGVPMKGPRVCKSHGDQLASFLVVVIPSYFARSYLADMNILDWAIKKLKMTGDNRETLPSVVGAIVERHYLHFASYLVRRLVTAPYSNDSIWHNAWPADLKCLAICLQVPRCISSSSDGTRDPPAHSRLAHAGDVTAEVVDGWLVCELPGCSNSRCGTD